MEYIIWTIVGYLSGSMLYGYLIPKHFCHIDVTEDTKDENPGTANAFAKAGFWVGSLVVLLELAKGMVPVWMAAHRIDMNRIGFAFVLVAPVIGHGFPWWRPGAGGKAIAVSFGCLLGLVPDWRPVLLLVCFYLLFSLVIVIEPHFFRTVVTYICFSAACIVVNVGQSVVIGCLMIAVVVIGRHYARYRGEHLEIHLAGRRRRV